MQTQVGLGIVRPPTQDPRGVAPRRAATARFAVTGGARPGELVLTMIDEGVTSPPGQPIVVLAMRGDTDAREVDRLLVG